MTIHLFEQIGGMTLALIGAFQAGIVVARMLDKRPD